VALDTTPLQYFCLQTEADRLLTRGETARALAYLGLFVRQPSSGSIDQNETDRILARSALTADEIERGMAAGAGLELDAVVQQVLADGSSAAHVPSR
jgi:hypothetical protein